MFDMRLEPWIAGDIMTIGLVHENIDAALAEIQYGMTPYMVDDILERHNIDYTSLPRDTQYKIMRAAGHA